MRVAQKFGRILDTQPSPAHSFALDLLPRRAILKNSYGNRCAEPNAKSMSTTNELLSNGAQASEIPTVSRPQERSAAAERARGFPYRFPRDRRQLGGKFSVGENARRLLRF